MSIWGELGLDGPTNDLKAIKRAYAKKLRVTRPDDNPEGFMALRQALEQAQFAAQYYEPDDEIGADEVDEITIGKDFEPQPTPAISVEPPEDSKTLDSALIIAPSPEENETAEPPKLSESEHIIVEVKALLSDTFGRTESAKWQAIFDDPRLDGIDTAIDFEHQFRDHLLEKFGYYNGDAKLANRNRKRPLITSRIGTLIFDTMGWRDLDSRPLYIQDQLNWLRTDLDVINRDRPKTQVKADIEYFDQYFDDDESGNFPVWVIAGIMFALYTLGKFLSNAYNNGMY